MNRPSIVLVFCDQLRADAIGVATPNLDALAEQSIRFETCITSAPLCRPARISLLSGQPVTVHRFDDNQRVPRPGSLPSHVAELRDVGYHTAVVGKTHLHAGTGHLDEHKSILEAWGYQEIVELPDAQMHQLRSAHADWLGADKHTRWLDYVAHHRPTSDPPDVAPWQLATEDHLDSYCAMRALEVLHGPRDRPLYLQVCFPGPHPPFDPPSEFLVDRAIPPAITGRRRGPMTELELRYRRAQKRWTPEAVERSRRAYFGKVALVDHCIGRVIAAIPSDAWIIVTADHGELLGDHGLFGKVLPYESAIRIPLLVRPPGGTVGRIERGAVDLLDVVATIRAIGGVASSPTILEGVRPDRTIVFGNMGYVGVRTPALTMTWDARTGEPRELYDRADDPHQLENRVEHPGYAAALRDGLSLRRVNNEQE